MTGSAHGAEGSMDLNILFQPHHGYQFLFYPSRLFHRILDGTSRPQNRTTHESLVRIVSASSEGSGGSAHMHRLASASDARMHKILDVDEGSDLTIPI